VEKIAGQELRQDAPLQEIVKALIEAYADEWVAGYYYMLTAQLVQGPNSEVIAKHFTSEAMEEIGEHAKLIGERLEQLGEEPPRDFASLYQTSPCKYPELPGDPYDIDGFIIAAVKAEICAIKAYRRLYDLAHGRDPVTEDLARRLLADEVRHRTELVNLLSREGLERLEKEVWPQ